MHTGAQAFTKSWGKTTQGAPGKEKLLFKVKCARLGQVPAHQPRLVLQNYTSSHPMSFTQDLCKLSNQGVAGAGGWGDALRRSGHPYLIWPFWGCLLLAGNGPWLLCRSQPLSH